MKDCIYGYNNMQGSAEDELGDRLQNTWEEKRNYLDIGNEKTVSVYSHDKSMQEIPL